MDFGRADWNSKLVNFFFAKPRLAILFLVGTLIGGGFALVTLQREGFPQVPAKVVGIATVYPGASATEVESQVSKIIENAVADVENVKEVSSTSAASFSQVVVTLDQDVNLDVAVQNIRSKVASVENALPEDAESSKVQTFSTSGDDFTVGILGDKSLTELNIIADTVANELTDVSGVGSVKEMEELKEHLVISYDSEKLAANKLTIEQVELVVKGSNIDFPIGTLDVDHKSQGIVVGGAYNSEEDLREQVVGVSPQGKGIKISDIAQVSKVLSGQEVVHRVGIKESGVLKTEQGVLLGILKSKDSDVIKVKDSIDKKVAELRDEKIVASDVRIEFLYDQAQSTRDQITEIVHGAFGDKSTFYLLGGIQLVLLFMLVFVNWRAALVAASAIPISFLFTLLCLYLTGTNLNTIVLFSLILVLGLIVDPAIVMVESIQRYLDLGSSSKEAIFATGRRYGAGLFIAVLTSIIVFIPFGIISGIFGEIIKYIPLTVVPALVASYLVPIAIVPLLGAKILKKKKDVVKKEEDQEIWPAARLMMRFNAWILSSNLRKVVLLIVIGGLIIFSTTLVSSGKIPVVQFSSPEDSPFLMVTAAYPKGATFEARNNIGKELEETLNGEGAIANYFYQVQSKDSSIILVTLELQKNRSEGDSSKRLIERLKDSFSQVKDVEVNLSELSVGPPEADYQVQVQLFDNDLKTLEKAGKEVGKYLSELDQVAKVDDGFTGKSEPEIRIIFDKEKLSKVGLSVFEVALQIKNQLDEKKISKLNEQLTDRTLEIFLAPDSKDLPKTKSEIENLGITTRTGLSVQLKNIGIVSEIAALDKIERFDNKRYINVRAKLKDSNDLVAVQTKLNEYLTENKLKELGIDSTGNRGEYDEIAKSIQELTFALIAAIFLTYLVLVLQFNSFSQPAIMLFTIPLSIIGVLPALYLVKGQLGFLEILGFTILVGIVENVAIFLIDYANQLTAEKNMSLKDAIVLSTGVRFRPIILTKMVALGGLLPLAIFSPFWRGLSGVMIGGILVSGFLSMTVVPIFYTWFGAIRSKVHKGSR